MGSQKWTQWKIQWRKKGSFSSKRETKKEKTNGMKRGKSLFVGGKRKKMNEKENQKKEDIKN